MAIDTPLKRYSAIMVSEPWRGTNVVPDALFPQGERQAAAFMYSGILAGGVVTGVGVATDQTLGVIHTLGQSTLFDTSMGVM